MNDKNEIYVIKTKFTQFIQTHLFVLQIINYHYLLSTYYLLFIDYFFVLKKIPSRPILIRYE